MPTNIARSTTTHKRDATRNAQDAARNGQLAFAQVPRGLVGTVSGGALMAWCALALRMNVNTWRCFPSQARLFVEAGLSRRHFQRGLQELIAAGWVSSRRRGRITNEYQLNQTPVAPPVAQQNAPPVAQQNAPPVAHEREPVNESQLTRASTATATTSSRSAARQQRRAAVAEGQENTPSSTSRTTHTASANNSRSRQRAPWGPLFDEVLTVIPELTQHAFHGLLNKLSVKGHSLTDAQRAWEELQHEGPDTWLDPDYEPVSQWYKAMHNKCDGREVYP